jgi:hypothetical protein
LAGSKQIEYPSSALVQYLKVASAAIGIIGVLLDVAVPIAQQLGKKKPAKEGLEGPIRMSVLLALVRGVPRMIGAVRTLRAQLSTQVAR